MRNMKPRYIICLATILFIQTLCFGLTIQVALSDVPTMQDGWPAVKAYDDLPPLERNAMQARRAIAQSDLFVRGWLKQSDAKTGLIPRNLKRDRGFWNTKDAAADNYPFMVLTSALTDRSLFEGRMLDMLRTETRLTSRIGRMPADWSFIKQDFVDAEPRLNKIIFGSSEYVKDGLMPLTEWLGPSPWSQRMSGIIDDIWKHAPVETPAGNIPSTNDEVNGEMMQITSRYYWMTGDDKYLDHATRIADWYLLGDRHPTRDRTSLRLRDHGCELISGLTEVYFACHYADKSRAQQYGKPLHAILDRILEVGVNEHGMMYDTIDPRKGTVIRDRISDSWGYNYNGFYVVYLLDGVEQYRDVVRHALKNLDHYRGYEWEGRSHDGYADSIECAINLYNRERVPEAADWIDSQMRIMLAMQKPDGIIGGWHGDGNFARTAIMYALWKQQGVTIQPWRENVRLGAELDKEGTLQLYLAADKPWEGSLVFDQPRHKTVMKMPVDYPRINQFPEWFTICQDSEYQIVIREDSRESLSDEIKTYKLRGSKLINGFPVELTVNNPMRFEVKLIQGKQKR